MQRGRVVIYNVPVGRLNRQASGGGGSFSVLNTASTVNGSNTVFVFSQAPTLIVADGIQLPATGNNGDVFWTIAGSTVTMTNAPSQSIYGIA